MRISYWSSDVCSSDLADGEQTAKGASCFGRVRAPGSAARRRPRSKRLRSLRHAVMRVDLIGRREQTLHPAENLDFPARLVSAISEAASRSAPPVASPLARLARTSLVSDQTEEGEGKG